MTKNDLKTTYGILGEGEGICIGEQFIIGKGDDKDIYTFSAKMKNFKDATQAEKVSDLYPLVVYYFKNPSGELHSGPWIKRSSAITNAMKDRIQHPSLAQRIFYHTKHLLERWKAWFSF